MPTCYTRKHVLVKHEQKEMELTVKNVYFYSKNKNDLFQRFAAHVYFVSAYKGIM